MYALEGRTKSRHCQRRGQDRPIFLGVFLAALLCCCGLWSLTEALGTPLPPASLPDYSNISALLASDASLNEASLYEMTVDQYVIYPRRPGNLSMVSAINATIYRILEKENTEVVGSLLTGIEFWIVTVTAVELHALLKIPNVSSCSQRSTESK